MKSADGRNKHSVNRLFAMSKRSGISIMLLVSVMVGLFIPPAPVVAQYQIPGVGEVKVPKIPGIEDLDIPGIDKLLGQKPALNTSVKDAAGEVPYLDDYSPSEFKSSASLKRGPKGGLLLKPGAYTMSLQSYCLQAGTYGPSRGEGYLYAPIKGKLGVIVSKIIRNSADHPDIPQRDVQRLLWAVLSRAKFDKLSPNLQRTASALLSEKDIFDLNGGAFGLIPENLRERLLKKLNPVQRQIFEAEENIRELLARGDAAFTELERYAVLAGDPPPDQRDRNIPRGRWTYHPDGFFIRYLPSSYSRTRVDIYVPEQFEIKRDNRGRITSVHDRKGNRIETEYDDTITPLTANTNGFRGYAFSSIRVSMQHPTASGRMTTQEWKNFGWTFVGATPGKDPKFKNVENFPGYSNRYTLSAELRKQLDDFKSGLNRLKFKGKWDGNTSDLIDLAHYKSGIEEAIRLDGQSSARQLEVLTNAWQSAMRKWAGRQQAKTSTRDNEDEGVIEPPPLPRPGDEDEEEAPLDPDDSFAWPEFDPSEDVAVPSEAGRQRIGISIRPVPDVISVPGGPRPELEKIRVFFDIAYLAPDKDKDFAFIRAARTWENEIRSSYSFKQGRDIYIAKGVRTKWDFIAAWSEIAEISNRPNHVAVEGSLFTHASFSDGNTSSESGLEFAADPRGGGSTLTRDDILQLPKIRWDQHNGQLALYGCNTGNLKSRGWAPAGVFSQAQKVRTLGEPGWSYFSLNKSKYVEIHDVATNVYLAAFWRARNSPLGSGRRMDQVVFSPKRNLGRSRSAYR